MIGIEVAGLALGGISTGISLLQYFHKTSSLDKLKELQEGLREDHVVDPKTSEDDEPLHWLAYSELITPLLKRRLLVRLLTVLGYVITSGVVLATDLTAKVSPELKNFDAVDFAIALSQILVALLGSSLFIGEPEATFLRNLSALNDHFYDKYVLPAIGKFNSGVADLAVVKSGRLKVGRQEERVRLLVEEEFKKQAAQFKLLSEKT